MAKKVQETFETKMTLNVPGRGRVVIEGNEDFVGRFFNDVKIEFVEQLTQALKAMKLRGGFDVVETTRGDETELKVVERKQAAS